MNGSILIINESFNVLKYVVCMKIRAEDEIMSVLVCDEVVLPYIYVCSMYLFYVV